MKHLPACLREYGMPQTSTEDVVECWKKYFKDLIDPTDKISVEEAWSDDERDCCPITWGRFTGQLQIKGKKLHWPGGGGGVEVFCLKTLEIVGVTWLTHYSSNVRKSGTLLLD